jgi:hypothetical protein
VVDSQTPAALPGDRTVVSLTTFSRWVAQPVTTVKRLFVNEVLDPAVVEKTSGGHWRLRVSSDDLSICHASIAIWKVLRRKPRIARSYNVRDPVRTFGRELIILEAEIDSSNKTSRVARARVKLPSPRLTERMLRNKLKVYKQALIILKKRRPHSEALWWYEQILERPKELAGTFILRLAIQRFRAKYRRFPKRIEIARELNISERSLYRRPFGREPLRFAYRGRIGADIETQGDVGDDHEESYIHESEQELPRDKRGPHVRKNLEPASHQVQRRRSSGELGRRKLRRVKARGVELVWEEDPIGPGEILRVYPVGSIEAKRRLEVIEPKASCSSSDTRASVKRNSRKIRRDLDLRERDSTFGGWTAAVYESEAGGKCRWWTNFDESRGRTDSAPRARRDILCVLDRSRARFPPIVNLAKMLAQTRSEA